MKCAFFSDLHIKTPGDQASSLFSRFCNNPKVKDADQIIFLGDMFDMLCGEKKGYLKKFDYFFEAIISFLDSGKQVIVLEGNHDFHFKRTLTNYIKKNSRHSDNFRYLKDGEYLELNGESYYFCHGDEVDFYNIYFKRWKRIYTSWWFAFIVNYIFPFFFIQWLGRNAAKDSKRRGKKTFDYHRMKEKYLVGADALIKERSVKGVISGHTHIVEKHSYENGTLYINNGFPLKDKKFSYFDGENFSLEEI